MAKKKSFLKEQKIRTSPFSDYWNKYNFYLLYLSLGILILGFYFMSVGSWDSFISLNISPLIIMVTYLLLLPAVILIKIKTKQKNTNVSSKG
jgi:hypothetical protein